MEKVRNEITKVVVEHKDRLSRFNFGVYERFFASNGVKIEWMDSGKSRKRWKLEKLAAAQKAILEQKVSEEEHEVVV